MKMALGSDHGGFALKTHLAAELKRRGIEVIDMGCNTAESCDYPDYAQAVAEAVAVGNAERGLLVCTTGIGMSIAANKTPGIRAALCFNEEMAGFASMHNGANVLVLPGRYVEPDAAMRMVKAWLDAPVIDGERHRRRVSKIAGNEWDMVSNAYVRRTDSTIYAALKNEEQRQNQTLNLIASENTVSRAVRQAQGSAMTNKYAEGYPDKRWYSGCHFVDVAEASAIERACSLFGAEHANVQPHCGSSANMAVYLALLQPGDTILAMNLAHGGHLTHGHPANFSGRLFSFIGYGVSRETERIDFDEVARLARERRPRMLVVGASAYSRTLDFAAFRAIADEVGAYLVTDMAHIAGLVAAGVHPSPTPFCDVVTSTTHKTLRGPRGGLILCREAYARDIDRQVFPGLQGGPLMHAIAAKAVCFAEAATDAFKAYGAQVLRNARALCRTLADAGFRIVSGGTDNHLFLVDVMKSGLTGRDAAAALDEAGIIVNKNAIPYDEKNSFVTSGIRIGTPTVTSRGMGEDEMREIGALIIGVLRDHENAALLAETRCRVAALMKRFPQDW